MEELDLAFHRLITEKQNWRGKMRPFQPLALAGLLALSSVALSPQIAVAQNGSVAASVVKVVDSGARVAFTGNVHPLARLQYDKGAVPDSLPIEHISLVLKRSAAKEIALHRLLEAQQMKSSPLFHKWVTPDQFGRQFGPDDAEIQIITEWLSAQGFHVNSVSRGRTMIDFSGDAGLVRAAFHTTIHEFAVKGEEHWANTSDPQLPAAVASMSAGIFGLHNFKLRAMHSPVGKFSRSKATGEIKSLEPQFTYASPDCSANCYALGPYDFATIYGVGPLWNAGIDGSGQSIAIAGQSNIHIQDVRDFRRVFGLAAKDPVIIIPPGSVDPGMTDDEVEADLDVQWAGAIARNAQIKFVTAPSVITSAEYVVDTNLAPILNVSFGLCESALGTTGNQMVSAMWQQAVAQGMSVIVASGDEGSAGCDIDTVSGAAETGLQVSGVASTPYNTAVGGTDFNQKTNAANYWNTTNTSTTISSAKGYIPETAWNDSCANPSWSDVGFSTEPEANCNNGVLAVLVAGGGGGKSSCTTLDGSNCIGGYAKPVWQQGPGVPGDGRRDIPDVSLFASNGFNGSFYVVCEADLDADHSNTSCDLNSPFMHFVGIGGTSASSPAFAGVMALVNQKMGTPQGFANPVLYSLAAQQPASNCGASNSCVFNDVTIGSIAMPCVKNTPDCIINGASDSIGILSGYSAASGYDLATGLGSVNVANLVNSWGSTPVTPVITDFGLFPDVSVVTVSAPGKSASVSITASSAGDFQGSLSLSCQITPPSPTDAPICSFIPGSVALSPSNPNAKTILNISTTPPLSAAFKPHQGLGTETWLMPGGSLALACIFLAKLPGRRFRRAAFFSLVAVFVLGVCVGCGGGGNGRINTQNLGTQAGTYTVTVTAVSGDITRTTTVSVVVQ